MSKIVVIGLGPGDIDSLTIGAVERMSDGNKVFLRTEKHPTVNYLKNKGIYYESYDYVYDEKQDFEQVYNFIAEDLVKKSKEYGIINYCVPGHPLVAEKTVSLLIDKEKHNEVSLEIIPGLSFIEPVILSIGHDPINGLKIIDGLNIYDQTVDINTDNLITQVYNRIRASEIKLSLMEIYDDEYEIYVIKSAGIKDEEKIEKIPLYMLDRLDWIDYLTTIFIPRVGKINRNRYDMNNLINIMETLRSNEGCPWDAKQTHLSLREYVIEEAYEVVDAIDNDDIDGLSEELGDLLLQVVFHSQIAKEEGYFNILDVISGICQKLIYRHPHVFKDIKADDADQAVESWNSMKDKEKNVTSYTERLKSIPNSFPSLLKSYKVQKRAADVGFDWDNITGAIDKLEEEYREVMHELKANDKEKLEEELGDLFFAIVNVCRFLDINPENAINKTINKFVDRFEFIEKESIKQGKDLKNMTLKEMDELWEIAKIHKNKKNDRK